MSTSRALAARNALGNVCRHHPDDESKKTAARLDLAEAKILDFAEDVLAAAPPLGPERLARIAALFRAGGAR